MMSSKIDSAAVETAIRAAADSLANDPDISWVRKSSIFQRAYFLGLLEGLASIAEEDAIGKRFVPLLIGTLRSKSADDTFSSAQLGQDFTALKTSLREIETGSNWDRHSIDEVNADIDSLDRRFRSCVKHAGTLIGEIALEIAGLEPPINSVARDREGEYEVRSRIHDRMSQLEEMMRFIALLETHHELDKRF